MTAAASPSTDLKSTLEELRASVAAEGMRRGLAGKIQEAILRILSLLLTIVEDFRAGRLAPIAPAAERAADGAGAAAPRRAGERARSGACPSSSRIGSHFSRQEQEPVAVSRVEPEGKPAASDDGARSVKCAAHPSRLHPGDAPASRPASMLLPPTLPGPFRPRRRRSTTCEGHPYGREAHARRLFSKMRLQAKGTARQNGSNMKTTT